MKFNTDELIAFVDLWNSLPGLETSKRSHRLTVFSSHQMFTCIVQAGRPVHFYTFAPIDNHAYEISSSCIPDGVRWTLKPSSVNILREDVEKAKLCVEEQFRRMINFKHLIDVFG